MQSVLTNSSMAIVRPCGALNAANATEFQQQLVEAISADESAALLVDMSQLESLDSAGLISLVSALRLAQQLSKRFTLCSVSPSIRIIFELTQLDRAFEMFDNRSIFEAAVS
ncbi:MAG: STAS domain-containing protein [Cyanothece sp. SIO1E1]|nr:STAS domain-containing protein [Cyanothece sp. SIO1E1]